MNGLQESPRLMSVQNVIAPIGTEKKCPKCGEKKPIEEFCFNKTTRSGRARWCNPCNRKNHKNWRKNNTVKIYKYVATWSKANPEKVRIYKQRWKDKYLKTPTGKTNSRMSASIRQSIKTPKNNRKWESLVGYTADQLKQHLEKQFNDGMSWENMGFWHIDHIVPISVFNFEKPEDEDFKRCWALKNLRPMWAKDNIRKHNKLNGHFQPSLIF